MIKPNVNEVDGKTEPLTIEQLIEVDPKWYEILNEMSKNTSIEFEIQILDAALTYNGGTIRRKV